jgi:hypothetical protein
MSMAPQPHDAPASPRRRGFVLTAFALGALALIDPRGAVRAVDAGFQNSPFMTVSRLVSTDALNVQTGQALYEALKGKASFETNLNALAKLAAAPGVTIETLAEQLDDTQQHNLRETLNEIVSAWYLGIVGNRTYAYASALMYRPTADVLSPPSYVRAGPLNWTVINPPTDGF